MGNLLRCEARIHCQEHLSSLELSFEVRHVGCQFPLQPRQLRQRLRGGEIHYALEDMGGMLFQKELRLAVVLLLAMLLLSPEFSCMRPKKCHKKRYTVVISPPGIPNCKKAVTIVKCEADAGTNQLQRMGLLDFDVAAVTDSNLGDGAWDCVVLVCENLDWPNFKNSFAHIKPAIEDANKIFSQAGPLNREFEDSRKYLDVTLNAMKRALKAGCRKPLLVLPGEFTFNDYATVCLLAALEACYVPLEIRQDVPKRAKKVDALGLYVGKGDSSSDYKIQTSIIEKVVALESGRIVARDIGGSDPERMAARKVAEYLQEIFKDSTIKISVEDDVGELNKKYPLLGAVNRAASRVDRHQGRVITLEYVGEGEIKSTYMFVGKGITYDTGGADVKAGGHMAGMHRDKCGAATVAGFFKTVDALKPSGIKVVGRLAMVRNSVGADSYVADEIITSAAGVRVRVGNTDAEGRMAMADPLHYTAMQALGEINPHLMTIATLTGHAIRAVGPEYTIVLDNGPAREKKFAQRLQEEGEKLADPFEDLYYSTRRFALGEINPHLMTIATLTGHAIRAVGPEYTIVLDNGPAREKKFAQRLQEEGEKLADPFEISTIRREDYKMIAGPSEYEDVLQCNNEPSSMTSRGHQFPAAFLIRTSGLDKHGVGCEKPLCYSHLDIAGSSGPFPGIPTGRPIVALAKIIGLF
eukprot:gene12109-2713_t